MEAERAVHTMEPTDSDDDIPDPSAGDRIQVKWVFWTVAADIRTYPFLLQPNVPSSPWLVRTWQELD